MEQDKPKTPRADLVELETTTTDQAKLKQNTEKPGLASGAVSEQAGSSRGTGMVFQVDLCGHFRADRQFRKDLCVRVEAD